jgi:uracil-DNA glycosylase
MPDSMSAENRQLLQHLQLRLEQLKNQGVDWVPKRVEELRLPTATLENGTPVDEPATETTAMNLFEDPDRTRGIPIEHRRVQLDLLRQEVAKCTRCPELSTFRTQTVFGVGNVGVELLFVGEAPGADEDRQGEPFVGAAGQMLNRILAASNLPRSEIYICNILRCRPPGNRPPKPAECKNCREYLERTIELVGPKVICCLGSVAAQNLLGVATPIGKMRGKFHEFQGIPVLCTYHPASLLEGRSPENKKLVWEDMKMLLARLGKPIPEGKKSN